MFLGQRSVSLNPMNESRLYMSLDLKTVYTRLRYIQYNMTNIFLHTVKAEIYIIIYNFFVLEISFNNEIKCTKKFVSGYMYSVAIFYTK